MKFAHDIDMEGNEIKNAANLVTNVTAGTNANQIAVTKNGTTSTLTINNVANATHANTATSATSATNAANATKATQDANGNNIASTYATKAEVSAIPKFAISVVAALPTTNISGTTLYLLKTGEETNNLYTEYIYVDNKWEKLGTQKLDLSGYVQKTQTVNGKALNGNISLTASDVGAAATAHNHTTANVTALTGYTIASAAAAITATDSLNTALGKLQKSVDGKQAAGSYAAVNHTHTAAAVGATKKYSATNPALTVTNGECTWTVTHNLGTQDVIAGLYGVSSKTQHFADVTIVSDNAISIKTKSSANLAAGVFKVVVIGG